MPVAATEMLVNDVDQLLTAGLLDQGLATALTSDLLVATALINDGKTTPATNKLEASLNAAISSLPPLLLGFWR
jgi:hypothetical protein